MTYDTWKSTDPTDEWTLGPEPVEEGEEEPAEPVVEQFSVLTLCSDSQDRSNCRFDTFTEVVWTVARLLRLLLLGHRPTCATPDREP
jgi:hypothetical protein